MAWGHQKRKSCITRWYNEIQIAYVQEYYQNIFSQSEWIRNDIHVVVVFTCRCSKNFNLRSMVLILDNHRASHYDIDMGIGFYWKFITSKNFSFIKFVDFTFN